MKNKINLILMLIFFTSCISINNITPKYVDDGSSILTENDKKRIHEFDTYFKFNKQDTLEYHFEYINSQNYKNKVSQNKYSWNIFFAPWCGHSGIILNRNKKTINENSNDSISINLISQSMDINNIQKMLKLYKITQPIYLVDPSENGTDEPEKIPNLLNKAHGKVRKWSTGSPHCVITDSNMQIVAYIRGDKTNLDTVLQYIKIFENRQK